VKHYSEEHAEAVLVRNPHAVVMGEAVDSASLPELERRVPWWQRLVRYGQGTPCGAI
jgi:hypothetical protein